MSHDFAQALRDADIAFDPNRPLPFVQLQLSARGEPVLAGATLTVQQGEAEVTVELPGLRELMTGDQPRPDFSKGAVSPYDLLFAAVEGAVADYCATSERVERDREVQRVYRRLRDRPDGDDRSPFLAHIRAVLRTFVALNPLSLAAYEAVLDQLLIGVRRLAHGRDSANYVRRILKSLSELEAKQLAAQETLAATAGKAGAGAEAGVEADAEAGAPGAAGAPASGEAAAEASV